MTVQAHVDPEVRRTWPAYEAAVVIAENVRNGPTAGVASLGALAGLPAERIP